MSHDVQWLVAGADSVSSLRPLKSSSSLHSSYDQTMYICASKLFSALQHEPRDDGTYEATQKRKAFKNRDKTIPYIPFESDSDRKMAYELAYTTLKCKYELAYTTLKCKNVRCEPRTKLIITLLQRSPCSEIVSDFRYVCAFVFVIQT